MLGTGRAGDFGQDAQDNRYKSQARIADRQDVFLTEIDVG
jgi:hypothetical protein